MLWEEREASCTMLASKQALTWMPPSQLRWSTLSQGVYPSGHLDPVLDGQLQVCCIAGLQQEISQNLPKRTRNKTYNSERPY